MNNDEKFSVIKKILGESPLIVEIGAHYGEDSKRFLNAFHDIKLYCIEPDPRNIKILKKYLKDNRISIHEIAISNRDGQSDFYMGYNEKITPKILKKYCWIDEDDYMNLNLNNSGASSLKSGYPLCKKKTIVNTMKLCTWTSINKITAIDFLWVDVQGSEREVIEGIGDVYIGHIWIEYGELEYKGSMTRKETILLLRRRGFALVDKYSSKACKGDLLFKNERYRKTY